MEHWTELLTNLTPGAVLRWSLVGFLSLLEVLVLIFLTAWLVGYL